MMSQQAVVTPEWAKANAKVCKALANVLACKPTKLTDSLEDKVMANRVESIAFLVVAMINGPHKIEVLSAAACASDKGPPPAKKVL